MKSTMTSGCQGRGQVAMGLTLITLGALFLAVELGHLNWRELQPFWPALVSLIGLNQMLGAQNVDELSKGAFGVLLGAWLFAAAQRLWGLSFYNSWPLLLIALGLLKIAAHLGRRNSQIKE